MDSVLKPIILDLDSKTPQSREDMELLVTNIP